MPNPAVHIRLDPQDMAKLEAEADRLGLTHTQLARSYILRALRQEENNA